MMRQVRELPPIDSCSIWVSLESLYGICLFFFVSVKALITFPRADNDLLIIFASSRVCPVAFVFSVFSDPAKSTKYNFPLFHWKLTALFWVIVIIKHECDLELCLFISVTPIDLFSFPILIIWFTS